MSPKDLRTDFQLVQDLGIQFVRYGPPSTRNSERISGRRAAGAIVIHSDVEGMRDEQN